MKNERLTLSNIQSFRRVSKPSTFQIWIAAARLRTLPLSMAGIITGNAIALSLEGFSWLLFVGALLTAISFQILSNFANDYGDGMKGTDNDNRLGPKRVLQQNLLPPNVLFKGIVTMALVALLLSLFLIFVAFGWTQLRWLLVFAGLALAAIWAAYNYTVGDRAYGYFALGDVFVFAFFGGVAVCGSYFLHEQTLSTTTYLLALAIGGLSVGVLNLNNLRDIENDRASNKRTIASLLGMHGGKIYHTILVLGSLLALAQGLKFAFLAADTRYMPLIVTIPLLGQLGQLWRIADPREIDRLLKPLALTTFGLSLLLFVSFWMAR